MREENIFVGTCMAVWCSRGDEKRRALFCQKPVQSPSLGTVHGTVFALLTSNVALRQDQLTQKRPYSPQFFCCVGVEWVMWTKG
jgi:hypothetical protein